MEDLVGFAAGQRGADGADDLVGRLVVLAADVLVEGRLAEAEPAAVRTRVRLRRLAAHRLAAVERFCVGHQTGCTSTSSRI